MALITKDSNYAKDKSHPTLEFIGTTIVEVAASDINSLPLESSPSFVLSSYDDDDWVNFICN